MADLKKGSTVGGKLIVTEDQKSEHVHSVEDLDGFGNSIGSDDGPGSNLDVDMINGRTLSDFDNTFIPIGGGTMLNSLELTGAIELIEGNVHTVATKETLENYLNIKHFPKIQSNSLSYVDGFSVFGVSGTIFSTTPCTVIHNGLELPVADVTIDVTSAGAYTGQEHQYFIYIVVDFSNESANVIVEDEEVIADDRLLIATVIKDSGENIETPELNAELKFLNQSVISNESKPESLVMSKANGKIDGSWKQIETNQGASVSLSGTRLVIPNETYEYTITDYNSFDTYTVTSDIAGTSISGNVITLNTATLEHDDSIQLTVSRNGQNSTFIIKVVDKQFIEGFVSSVENFANLDSYMGGAPFNSNVATTDIEYSDNPKIYVYGGIYIEGEGLFSPTSSPEEFEGFLEIDVKNKSWRFLPFDPGNIVLSGITFANNKIYLLGGCPDVLDAFGELETQIPNQVSNKLWVFDIDTETWEEKQSLPVDIYGSSLVSFDTNSNLHSNPNYLVSIGGMGNDNDSQTNQRRTLYVYDIDDDSWHWISDFPNSEQILVPSVSKVYNTSNQIVMAGGSTVSSIFFTDILDVYQTDSSRLSNKAFVLDVSNPFNITFDEKQNVPDWRIPSYTAAYSEGNNAWFFGCLYSYESDGVDFLSRSSVLRLNISTNTWSIDDIVSNRLFLEGETYGFPNILGPYNTLFSYIVPTNNQGPNTNILGKLIWVTSGIKTFFDDSMFFEIDINSTVSSNTGVEVTGKFSTPDFSLIDSEITTHLDRFLVLVANSPDNIHTEFWVLDIRTGLWRFIDQYHYNDDFYVKSPKGLNSSRIDALNANNGKFVGGLEFDGSDFTPTNKVIGIEGDTLDNISLILLSDIDTPVYGQVSVTNEAGNVFSIGGMSQYESNESLEIIQKHNAQSSTVDILTPDDLPEKDVLRFSAGFYDKNRIFVHGGLKTLDNGDEINRGFIWEYLIEQNRWRKVKETDLESFNHSSVSIRSNFYDKNVSAYFIGGNDNINEEGKNIILYEFVPDLNIFRPIFDLFDAIDVPGSSELDFSEAVKLFSIKSSLYVINTTDYRVWRIT